MSLATRLDAATPKPNDASTGAFEQFVANRPIGICEDVETCNLRPPLEKDDRAGFTEETTPEADQPLP